jgi:MoxR-like ATPase
MVASIFISYRREDSSAEANNLRVELIKRFGSSRVFFDTALPGGEPWPDRIRDALQTATVVLVVIGPDWLTTAERWGKRRIDQRNDWVRQEVAYALRAAKRVIPVRVRRAERPPAAEMPRPLRALADRQDVELRHDHWDADVQNLIEQIGLALADENPPASTSAEDDTRVADTINAAILLRRPLLVVGRFGAAKSSLAYAVAHELGAGPVLRWPLTSRSVLREGLYHYDEISRRQEMELAGHQGTWMSDIGAYIMLGPLGTALLPRAHPRVLFVERIDRADADLLNDLRDTLQEGAFSIPELARIGGSVASVTVSTWDGERVAIVNGLVECQEFPVVILTGDNEQELPSAFLRRCLQLVVPDPDQRQLERIAEAHLATNNRLTPEERERVRRIIMRALAG